MVILNKFSAIDKESYPLCHIWDALCRQNYASHQRQIDRCTYSLQRSRRSIFTFGYPKLYQFPIIRLQVLKRKQYLGEIYQSELNRYKQIDPWVQWNYNRCFKGSRLTSFISIGVGAMLAAILKKKFRPMVRFMVFCFPVITEQVFIRPNATTFLKVNQFLDFTIAIRRARCLLELFGEDFATDLNRMYLKGGNVLRMMQSMTRLNESKSI